MATGFGGQRMYRTTRRIQSLTSYKAHLAMGGEAARYPPEDAEVWAGWSWAACLRTAGKSVPLVCEIVGRELVVYDSFEGLPAPDPGRVREPFRGERHSRRRPRAGGEGERTAARRHRRCSFVKGIFADTLPHARASRWSSASRRSLQGRLFSVSVINLWAHLTEKGYVFIDEYVFTDYCALFYSERYWRENFDATPPGLLGAGTGVGVGSYYLGPWSERGDTPAESRQCRLYAKRLRRLLGFLSGRSASRMNGSRTSSRWYHGETADP